MKFLADENFPKPLADKIKKAGHAVKTIQQKSLRGSSDRTVAEIAAKEKSIILTFDKDFLKKVNSTRLIIVFKFPRVPTEEIIPLVDKFLRELNSRKQNKAKILTFSKTGLHEIIR